MVNSASRPDLATIGIRKGRADADHARRGGDYAIQASGESGRHSSVGNCDRIGKLSAGVIASAERVTGDRDSHTAIDSGGLLALKNYRRAKASSVR